LCTEPVEFESVEFDFEPDSLVPGKAVVVCSPAGVDGDSFGFFGPSNSIGPRTLGRSGAVDAGDFFVSGVVGSASCPVVDSEGVVFDVVVVFVLFASTVTVVVPLPLRVSGSAAGFGFSGGLADSAAGDAAAEMVSDLTWGATDSVSFF
jgi:hypothetical protein